MSDAMTLEIDPRNAGQLREWDGAHGLYWAKQADAYDAAYAHYQPALLAAAAVRPGERILDVGCGSGQVAIDLVRATPHSTALGVDLSSAQLEVGRARAVGLDVEFLQADAQVHDFGAASYDLVVSRTGTMFFSDQAMAFANLARCTKPGGRLTILVWRGVGENEWFREFFEAVRVGRDLSGPPPGTPGPFSQSDPAVVEPLLHGAGWTDIAFAPADEPIWFGADSDNATSFILGQLAWLLADLDEAKLREATDNLHAVMAAHESHVGVELSSAAWLITARR
jgi:SAM-dependent methyltransferase